MNPNAEHAERPVTALLEDVLGCKWSWSILRAVRKGTTRPGRLEREIAGISTKVLNERLRKLVAHGVLIRTEFPEIPPRVEYAYTALGRKFYAVLEQIEALERERAGTGDAAGLAIRPLTPERWSDLETLFNASGCAQARNCWCMYYRRSGASPAPARGTRAQADRAALKTLVDAGRPPGLIAYRGKTPVGWLSVGPRADYAKLARSPVMKPVDDQPVWSVVCFVVPPAHRGQGIARALLDGAIAYAREQGATLIEAYPVDRPGRSDDDALWFGTKSMYDAAGFEEVARRKPQRPVMRLRPA